MGWRNEARKPPFRGDWTWHEITSGHPGVGSHEAFGLGAYEAHNIEETQIVQVVTDGERPKLRVADCRGCMDIDAGMVLAALRANGTDPVFEAARRLVRTMQEDAGRARPPGFLELARLLGEL